MRLIAELLVRALAANGADATRHLSPQDHRAEVYVWRVHEGEDTPYVAVVEGPDSGAFTPLCPMHNRLL